MPDASWIDQQLSAGTLAGIGELVFNYAGMAPDDPAMAAYWAMAARHDVPAFVHIGRGPGPGQGPRRHEGCCPQYQADFGNPALLRSVLKRHPRLRLVVQHAGFDYLDETVSLMRDFPNVYLDMSVLNSIGPRPLHDASLRKITDAGFANRIVLGSDDQDYALIIERIEGASFLTPAQRRGIYYDNAARFLRLDRATVARDHGR
jgi:predicted TIM-barrel fold metal-dependent hydrolase